MASRNAARLHKLNVFSAGFVLGMLGMYIAACLYGYRRVTWLDFKTDALRLMVQFWS
jgi:hypothetical protein